MASRDMGSQNPSKVGDELFTKRTRLKMEKILNNHLGGIKTLKIMG